MTKQFVAKTKNGIEVHVDMINSHAATHLKDTPQLLDLVKEILPRREVLSDKDDFDIDIGRPAGLSDLVATENNDDIFFAKRLNRQEYTRFVKNKTPGSTNYVSLYLEKNPEGSYDLITAYIGEIVPPFPTGKEDLNQISRDFWSKHALVFGRQEIVPGSEAIECPW